PGVVAVEPAAPVEEELRARPWTQDRGELGRHPAGMRAARVGGLEGIDIEPVPVEAQAGDGSQPGTPRDLALGKDGGARLAHGVVADRVEALARAGLVQADVDAVVPPLQSYGVAQRQPAHARLPGPPQLAAGGAAPVGLLELVPV